MNYYYYCYFNKVNPYHYVSALRRRQQQPPQCAVLQASLHARTLSTTAARTTTTTTTTTTTRRIVLVPTSTRVIQHCSNNYSHDYINDTIRSRRKLKLPWIINNNQRCLLSSSSSSSSSIYNRVHQFLGQRTTTIHSNLNSNYYNYYYSPTTNLRKDNPIVQLIDDCCRLQTLQGMQYAESILDRLRFLHDEHQQKQQHRHYRRPTDTVGNDYSFNDNYNTNTIPISIYQTILYGWAMIASNHPIIARQKMEYLVQLVIDNSKSPSSFPSSIRITEKHQILVPDEEDDNNNKTNNSKYYNCLPNVQFFNTYLLGLSILAKTIPSAAVTAESILYDMIQLHNDDQDSIRSSDSDKGLLLYTKPNSRSYTYVLQAYANAALVKSKGRYNNTRNSRNTTTSNNNTKSSERVIQLLQQIHTIHHEEKRSYEEQFGIPYNSNNPTTNNKKQIVSPDSVMYSIALQAIVNDHQHYSESRDGRPPTSGNTDTKGSQCLDKILLLLQQALDNTDDICILDDIFYITALQSISKSMITIPNPKHRYEAAQLGQQLFEWMLQERTRSNINKKNSTDSTSLSTTTITTTTETPNNDISSSSTKLYKTITAVINNHNNREGNDDNDQKCMTLDEQYNMDENIPVELNNYPKDGNPSTYMDERDDVVADANSTNSTTSATTITCTDATHIDDKLPLQAYNTCLDVWSKSYCRESPMQCEKLLRRYLGDLAIPRTRQDRRQERKRPSNTATSTVTNHSIADSKVVPFYPDTISFNTCMYAWSKSNKYYKNSATRAEDLLRLLRKMARSNSKPIQPDFQSYAIVINAFAYTPNNNPDKVIHARRILDDLIHAIQSGEIIIGNDSNQNRAAPFTAVINTSARTLKNTYQMKNNTTSLANDFDTGATVELDSNKDPYYIAIKTYNELKNDAYNIGASPDHHTFSAMIRCIATHCPIDSTEREQALAMVVDDACQAGEVSRLVVQSLQTINNTATTTSLGIIKSSYDIPRFWKRNVPTIFQ